MQKTSIMILPFALLGWLACGQVSWAQLDRDEAVMLYQTMYLESREISADWTGDIAACNAGTTSSAYQQAAIDVINYYRLLAGLPDNVARANDERVAQVQQAALMMAATNRLSHSPSASDFDCYSSAGATGAGRSNLALGSTHIDAIDLYMDDPGSGNSFVGHRRWILYPRQTTMASGSVPRANALWVLGPFGSRIPTPDGTAWPAAGFVPYDLLPRRSNRWSFSFPNADFSHAVVSMNGPDGVIEITLEQLDNRGFGDRTLVWRPNGISYNRPDQDQQYQVTIDDVVVDGQTRRFSYQVTVIDPTAMTPSEVALFSDSFE